jgi:mono/diheme cytochrome c family protein
MLPRSLCVWPLLCFLLLAGCGTSGTTTTAGSTVPTEVNAALAGANQLEVSWQPVAGATSYNIYWSPQSGVTTTTGTKITGVSSPYTLSGLTANTTYYYIVTAVTGSSESSPSSQASATALALPVAPAGTSATASGTTVTVSWSPVTSAASYNIYWSLTSGVTTTNGTKIANATSPAALTSLSANTTYYYIVTAVNGIGEGPASTQFSASTAAVTGDVPAAPTGVTATAGYNQVIISWSPVAGAASYNIYWSNDPMVMEGMSAKITGVSSPYDNTGLDASTVYNYIVSAVNASGESLPSPIVTATTSAVDGYALYAANCASCHNAIATSTRLGVSASVIQSAISGNDGGMGSLSTLTATQIQAIAAVLAFPE